MKVKKKGTVRIPKIRVDKNGKNYIMLGKKKVFLSKGLSERELIKFIIKRLHPKRKVRKVTARSGINYPKGLDTSTATQFYDKLQHQNEQAKNDLKEAKQQFQQEIKQIEYKPEKQDGKQPTLMLEYKDESGHGYTKEQIDKGLALLKQQDEALKQAKARVKDKNQIISEHRIELKKKRSDYLTSLVRKELDNYTWEELAELAKENELPTHNGKPRLTKETLRKSLIHAGVLDLDAMYEEMKLKYPDEYVDRTGAYSPKSDDDIDESDFKAAPDISGPVSGDISLQGNGKVDRDGMNTDQINKIMRKYPEFLGCIGSDQIDDIILPQVKPRSRICWVQNTEQSWKDGRHWVAVMIDARSDGSHSVEYYNPLGSGSVDKVPKAFIKNIKPVLQKLQTNGYLKFKENMIPDQSASSSNCGQFSIKFLIDRLRGRTFSEASGWNKLGEKKIEEWKKKLPAFRYIDGFAQNGEGVKEVYNAVKGVVKKGVSVVKRLLANTPIRKQFSPSIRNLLQKYGSNKISGIRVYRQPINSVINKVLNWVTLGTFQKNLRELNYDQAFHLFMYITLDNGVTIRLDKNHVIEAKVQQVPRHDKAEEKVVSEVRPIALNDFLNKGIDSVGVDHYFTYDSRNKNCQDWILVNLKANNMLSADMRTFIYQDPEKIYKNLGILGEVNKRITDLAGKADVILNGEGKPKRKISR